MKITGKHIGETSRKSRVKMHKSGKHWVKTLMSQIGLIRLTGASAEQVKVTVDDVDTVTSKHSKSIALLKGIAATGAVVSGVGMLAHEVEAEDVTNADQSTQNDTVNLTETTVTTTVDATETAPTTVTEATTEATTEVSSEAVTTAAAREVETENNSESISQSLSESVSVSLSESVSLSVSESVSESISESV
nr:accessory Sec-dependent serine-rich glycoprotein adhesin [Enterococcus cecorum]